MLSGLCQGLARSGVHRRRPAFLRSLSLGSFFLKPFYTLPLAGFPCRRGLDDSLLNPDFSVPEPAQFASESHDGLVQSHSSESRRRLLRRRCGGCLGQS